MYSEPQTQAPGFRGKPFPRFLLIVDQTKKNCNYLGRILAQKCVNYVSTPKRWDVGLIGRQLNCCPIGLAPQENTFAQLDQRSSTKVVASFMPFQASLPGLPDREEIADRTGCTGRGYCWQQPASRRNSGKEWVRAFSRR